MNEINREENVDKLISFIYLPTFYKLVTTTSAICLSFFKKKYWTLNEK